MHYALCLSRLAAALPIGVDSVIAYTYKGVQLRYRFSSALYHDHPQQKPWTLAPEVFYAYAECLRVSWMMESTV